MLLVKSLRLETGASARNSSNDITGKLLFRPYVVAKTLMGVLSMAKTKVEVRETLIEGDGEKLESKGNRDEKSEE